MDTGNPIKLGVREAILREGAGTSDYNDLKNIATLNGVTLKGNLTSEDLGLVSEERFAALEAKLALFEDLSLTMADENNDAISKIILARDAET